MNPPPPSLRRRLVESLYAETMVLADEARSYFDLDARMQREAMRPADRVALSVESLRATTRLMHLISWLLTRRAVESGEIGEHEARGEVRRLADVPATADETLEAMPREARDIIQATMDLLGRGLRLQESIEAPDASGSPAHDMMERLRRAVQT